MHLGISDPKKIPDMILALERESRLQVKFRLMAELNQQATNRLETITSGEEVGQREVVAVTYYLLASPTVHGYDVMDIDVGFKHYHRNLPGLMQGTTTIEEAIKDWNGVSQKVHKRELKLVAVIEVKERLPLWEDPSYSIYVYRDEIPLE
jgi:hypothetical protein